MIERLNQWLLPLEILIQKYRKYISIFILFWAFCSVFYIFDESSVTESGSNALLILWIILWLPIVARVIWLKIAKLLLPLRKELGILMWILALVHGSRFFLSNPDFIWTRDFWYFDWQINFLAFGFFALLLSLPLTLTSNLYSMKKMGKWWKRLHRSAYLIALLTVIHVVLLKWSLYFEFAPVLILVAYLIGKTLEWKGISLLQKQKDNSYPKWQKYYCVPCGYIYDPLIWDEDSGILPGTEFRDIPDDWRCVVCGVTKSDFLPYIENEIIPTHEAIITNKVLLNSTTLELTIECEEDIMSEPGQFMSFVWKDALWEFIRQYSIAEKVWKSFIFTIKLSEEWRGSKLLREIPIATKIHINWVFGTFLIKEIKNPKIFIATGTGLAPIYNMIRSLEHSPLQSRVYFSVAKRSDLFYEDRLRAIKNIELHICTTREEVDWCTFGRVDVDTIEADTETEWYLCGNPRMISEAREKLEKRWFTKIYTEEFS